MQPVLDFFSRWFWLSIPATVAHILWCWYRAYPIYLKSRIKDRRSPKPWVYLPIWWKKPLSSLAYPVTMALSLLSMLAWTGGILRFTPAGVFWIAGIFVCVSVVVLWLQRICLSQNYLLQRECYFRDYRELAYEYHSKGKTIQDTDLRNRCMWEHQQALRKAEQSGHLYRYLRAKAKSQKQIGVLDDNDNHAG